MARSGDRRDRGGWVPADRRFRRVPCTARRRWPGRSGLSHEPRDQRTGVASEAVGALFDWATEQGARHFRAAVAQDNVASLAVVARLGFRRADLQHDDVGGTELIFDLDRWPVEPVEPAWAVKP